MELVDNEEKAEHDGFDRGKVQESLKISFAAASSGENESVLKGNSTNIPERAAALLKKKVPTLTDKELNSEFFQKLENRSLDDFPVEVMVPRRCLQSSHSQIEGQQENCRHLVGTPNSDRTIPPQSDDSHGYKNSNAWDKRPEQRLFWAKDSKAKPVDVDDRSEESMKDLPPGRLEVTRLDGHTEGTFISSKASWSPIQRQLAQLERQQTSIMNMLQVCCKCTCYGFEYWFLVSNC